MLLLLVVRRCRLLALLVVVACYVAIPSLLLDVSVCSLPLPCAPSPPPWPVDKSDEFNVVLDDPGNEFDFLDVAEDP